MAGPIPTKTIQQLTEYGSVVLNGTELFELWSTDASWRIPARFFVLPTDGLITHTGQQADLPGSRQLVGSSSVHIADSGPGGTLQLTATFTAAPSELQAIAPAAGTINDLAIEENVGYLDVDTALGDVVLTGADPFYDDQILVITNTGINRLVINSLDPGSQSFNRFRLPANMTLLLNSSLSVRYCQALALWIPL